MCEKKKKPKKKTRDSIPSHLISGNVNSRTKNFWGFRLWGGGWYSANCGEEGRKKKSNRKYHYFHSINRIMYNWNSILVLSWAQTLRRIEIEAGIVAVDKSVVRTV